MKGDGPRRDRSGEAAPPRSDGSLLGVLGAVRRHLRRGAGAAVGLSALATAGIVLTLAWLLAGAEGWRAGTPVPLLLVAAGLLGIAAIAVRTLSRVRRWTREPRLAAELERQARLPEGSVRAQAELGRSLPAGVSPSLARAGEGAILRRLPPGVASRAGTPGREIQGFLRAAGAGGVLAVLLVAGLWVASPDRARAAWAGLARPAALLVPDPLPPLELRPGDASVERGTSPRIEILADGRDSVSVHWRAVGELFRERVLPVTEGRAETELPPLDAEVRYWASSPDGARSGEHVLRPADPSVLSDLTVEATFPPHTGIPDETFRTLPELLSVPEGTVLDVSGGIVGEGTGVSLVGVEGEPVAQFPAARQGFSGTWRPEASGVVRWHVEGGRDGALLPPPFEIEIIPDLPPDLAFPVPGSDGELPLSLRVPIVLEATDDYGVAWLEIETVLRTADGREVEGVVDRIPAGNRPQVTARPTLDFSDWDVRPGDEILLRARAGDNAPQTQVTRSETFRLRMPAAAALREGARERIEESSERAAELLERTDREARELRDRQLTRSASARSGAGDGAQGFQEREETRDLLERQTELTEELDGLRQELADAQVALGDEDVLNRELRERIRELERMLEDLVPPEMRERMEELREALENGEMPESAGQLLEEISERQEEIRERLERALERLERSVLEESFRGAEEDLRELADQQEELVDLLAEGDGDGLERQQELGASAETVEERLAELEQRLRDAGESDAGDRASDAQRGTEEAREAMERASEAAEEGQQDQAARDAGDAAEALEGALQELESAREQWSQEWWEAITGALRRGAHDALSLARAQGELIEAMTRAGRAGWSRYEPDQAAFLQALRNLANDLSEGLREVPSASRQASEEIAVALEAVRATLGRLEDRLSARPNPGVEARRAQDHMNRVALLALRVLEELESEVEIEPDMDQLMEELSSITAQQEALNEEAQSMADDPEGDGAVGDSGELALAQEAIAGALRDLANRPGGGETTPVDLEELADEGTDIAEVLSGGRLDATTLERQELLLERLLSAGRTLEREGPTEEREGTTAEPGERTVVSPLPEALLEAISGPAPDPEALEALTPGQRRLVLDYFERVGRRDAVEGAP